MERTIDHASQDASERGIGVSASVSKNVARGRRPDSMLQRYLQENRITVERAPVGMSRQKSNLTRPTKRNHVVWTVEWVDLNGARTVQNDCLESASMRELYESLQTEKRNAKQRVIDGHGDDSSQRGVKRKRNETKVEEGKGQPPDSTEDAQKGEPSAAPTSTISPPAPPNELEDDPVPKPESTTQEPSGPKSSAPESSNAALNFYLLRPSTTGRSKVIIPLSSTSTLTESLRDRTVQEFPTIVVLSETLDALPEGYILESAYNTTQARIKAKEKLVPGHERTGQNADSVPEADEPVDAQGILDMLKRDVGV